MTMSNKNIEEIAELLDSGMTCFYHHPTGIIEYHPDLTDPYFDPESWAGVIDKIKSDRPSAYLGAGRYYELHVL